MCNSWSFRVLFIALAGAAAVFVLNHIDFRFDRNSQRIDSNHAELLDAVRDLRADTDVLIVCVIATLALLVFHIFKR